MRVSHPLVQVGEGEKLVKALFAVARWKSPCTLATHLATCARLSLRAAVIFVDEIDSLLTSRTESDIESSRRIKTEFLVQMEGISQDPNERLLFIGATNRCVVVWSLCVAAHLKCRPQELDNAALRRLPKRLYIPLPDDSGRRELLLKALERVDNDMSEADVNEIVKLTDGYSGSDLWNLSREAALFPLREIPNIADVDSSTVRRLLLKDFVVRRSVAAA